MEDQPPSVEIVVVVAFVGYEVVSGAHRGVEALWWSGVCLREIGIVNDANVGTEGRVQGKIVKAWSQE